ncbi:MAG: hypothetical protein V3V92_01215 [Candidatus Hydrothermarchaeales archaeon]
MKVKIILFVVLGILVLGYIGTKQNDQNPGVAPRVVPGDLGAIEVKGGGLPGYDIDEDGIADYIQFGFQHFVEIYNEGGFDYPGGEIQIQELPRSRLQPQEIGRNITIPSMHFFPSDLVESSVGSVAIFTAKDEGLSLEIDVLYKTLGRHMDTYAVLIRDENGIYQIKDITFGEGAGTIELGEVEKLGVSFPKE